MAFIYAGLSSPGNLFSSAKKKLKCVEGKARLGPAVGRTLLREVEILDHTAALVVRAPYPTLLLPS